MSMTAWRLLKNCWIKNTTELVHDRGKIWMLIRLLKRIILWKTMQKEEIFFYSWQGTERKEDISAVHFSHRIKWITQRIRHHGLCFIRRKKKVTLSTGEEEILYDRLKKRVTGITASKLYGLDAVFWCVRWAHALTGESPQSARQ